MDPWIKALEPRLLALKEALLARHATVATAESCTGGLVATLLTHLPGSSAVFLGGVSAYANQAKIAVLGVSADVLAQHGAVSAEVAEAMARGAQQRFGATYAVALTGVAGPDGGTPTKPVGTVYVGLVGPEGASVKRLSLSGDRENVRRSAADAAVALLAAAAGSSS